MTTPAMIEARGLAKRYRSALAVDNLSFDVRPGTVTGFLGPNGAGKPVTRLRHSKEVSTETGAVHRGCAAPSDRRRYSEPECSGLDQDHLQQTDVHPTAGT